VRRITSWDGIERITYASRPFVREPMLARQTGCWQAAPGVGTAMRGSRTNSIEAADPTAGQGRRRKKILSAVFFSAADQRDTLVFAMVFLHASSRTWQALEKASVADDEEVCLLEKELRHWRESTSARAWLSRRVIFLQRAGKTTVWQVDTGMSARRFRR